MIKPDGRTLSYTDVTRIADDRFRDFKSGLAFIESAAGIETIIAYVGAVRAGLTVHILSPDKPKENARLIELYQPDIIVENGQPIRRSAATHPESIHPDLAFLLSTSGSTGASKFVKLSRTNIESNTRSICRYLALQSSDRGVTNLGLSYSYGLSVLNAHLAVGASLLVTDTLFESPKFWNELREHEVTNFSGVPYHFERMLQGSTPFSSWPALRFLTQAGGKLSSDYVRQFADMGTRDGFEFFVMYGQTEASPRMSYLPPHLAREKPGSIGIAVPDGRLWLVDPEGERIDEPGVEGELVYSGPNVMCGYANERADLAGLEPQKELRTGDFARVDEDGVFTITGRASRFVKPFGLRVSLDEIERWVSEQSGENAVVGDDDGIVIAVTDPSLAARQWQEAFASRCGLPGGMVRIEKVAKLPRLANGKTDYPALTARFLSAPLLTRSNKGFLGAFAAEFWGLLTGRSERPESALAAYRIVLGDRVTSEASTFMSAGGDSLNMVQLQILLEDYVGDLPDDWPDRPVREIEQLVEVSGV